MAARQHNRVARRQLRDLDIGNPTHEQASLVYSAGGAPTPSVYKTVQDYLFRVIATECGRLGMAVHIHGMAGAGSYFSQAGVNPMNLEPLLNDPANTVSPAAVYLSGAGQ